MNWKLLNITWILGLALTCAAPAAAQVAPTMPNHEATVKNSKADTTDKGLLQNAKEGVQKVTDGVKAKSQSHKAKKKAEIVAAIKEKEAQEKVLQTRRDVQARKMMDQIDPGRRPATLTYALRDNHNLKMDVWQPQQQRTDKACVVYVFGGGFFCGSRNDSSSIAACQALTEKGFVAVSIDYRLGLRETEIDTLMLTNITNPFIRSINWAVEDLCSALRYLCLHAVELNIDPARIVLTGASAGAITVLQTDYDRANGLPSASELPADFMPLAVVSYSGGLLLQNGGLKYATPPAPTFLLHGTRDRIVDYNSIRPSLQLSLKGSNKIARVMKKENYPYWFFRCTDRGHEVNTYLPATINEFTLFVDMVAAGFSTYCDATYENTALPQSPNVNKTVFDLYFK